MVKIVNFTLCTFYHNKKGNADIPYRYKFPFLSTFSACKLSSLFSKTPQTIRAQKKVNI